MGNALRMGMMGALVGGMAAELRRWETERAEAAEQRKQERLEQILMERESRQETRQIESEGRQETRAVAAEGRADTRAIASEGREDTRWDSRFGRQSAEQRAQAAQQAALSFGNSSALQEDSQAHSIAESAKDRAATIEAAAARGGNDTDKPIRLLIENASGQQQLVDLEPGEAIPSGWRAITTNNAGSPMPSASKTTAPARTAPAATGKPRDYTGFSVVK